jgi:hypothetical protein
VPLSQGSRSVATRRMRRMGRVRLQPPLLGGPDPAAWVMLPPPSWAHSLLSAIRCQVKACWAADVRSAPWCRRECLPGEAVEARNERIQNSKMTEPGQPRLAIACWTCLVWRTVTEKRGWWRREAASTLAD